MGSFTFDYVEKEAYGKWDWMGGMEGYGDGGLGGMLQTES